MRTYFILIATLLTLANSWAASLPSELTWTYAVGNTSWAPAGLHSNAVDAAQHLCNNYVTTHSRISDRPTLGIDFEYVLTNCTLGSGPQLSASSWVARVNLQVDVYRNNSFEYSREYSHHTVTTTTDCDYGLKFHPDTLSCVPPVADSCSNPKVANPIEVATGRKKQHFLDYSGRSITIEREISQIAKHAAWGFSFLEKAAYFEAGSSQFVQISNGASNQYLIKQSDACWKQPGGRCYQVEILSDSLKITDQNKVKLYDEHGRLISRRVIGHPHRSVTYAHTSSGVTMTAGDETVIADIDAAGLTSAIRTPKGNIIYQYSPQNRLLEKVIYPDQNVEEYVYSTSVPHVLKELRRGNETYAFWNYDSQKRVIRSWHSENFDNFSLAYSNSEVTVTNPLGRRTRYIFDIVDNVALLVEVEGEPSPNCAAASKFYEYYSNGALKSKTDWSGNITTYMRDGFGREISRTEAAGTPEARIITTEYHPTLNLPLRIAEPGQVEVMTYDGEGRLLSKRIQPTAAPSP